MLGHPVRTVMGAAQVMPISSLGHPDFPRSRLPSIFITPTRVGNTVKRARIFRPETSRAQSNAEILAARCVTRCISVVKKHGEAPLLDTPRGQC